MNCKRLIMTATFKIMHKNQFGIFKPLQIADTASVSAGAFQFLIGRKSIPFDWDEGSITEKDDTTFLYESGYGGFANNFHLSDFYDEDLEKLGLCRSDLTAKFLSAVSCIEDFYVNFDKLPEQREVDCGSIEGNIDSKASYKVQLLGITLSDYDTPEIEYHVSKSVISDYNRGVR